MRPIDHGGKGVWHCISERAINRTYYPAVTWTGRDLRAVTVEEFRAALEALTRRG